MHTMREDVDHHSAAVWQGKASGIMPGTEISWLVESLATDRDTSGQRH